MILTHLVLFHFFVGASEFTAPTATPVGQRISMQRENARIDMQRAA